MAILIWWWVGWRKVSKRKKVESTNRDLTLQIQDALDCQERETKEKDDLARAKSQLLRRCKGMEEEVSGLREEIKKLNHSNRTLVQQAQAAKSQTKDYLGEQESIRAELSKRYDERFQELKRERRELQDSNRALVDQMQRMADDSQQERVVLDQERAGLTHRLERLEEELRISHEQSMRLEEVNQTLAYEAQKAAEKANESRIEMEQNRLLRQLKEMEHELASLRVENHRLSSGFQEAVAEQRHVLRAEFKQEIEELRLAAETREAFVEIQVFGP
eukprot:scaffold744_cov370-Prasinococcus_capsulatus_cf.AAC.13